MAVVYLQLMPSSLLFHLVGEVGEALVSHVEERGLTSRLDLLVKLVGAGRKRTHGRRKRVVPLFLLSTPEKLVLAVRLLRLSLSNKANRRMGGGGRQTHG